MEIIDLYFYDGNKIIRFIRTYILYFFYYYLTINIILNCCNKKKHSYIRRNLENNSSRG